MNLTSVKYQDSCIYIGLNGSQNERESKAFLQKIRSVYVVYKIKAFGRQVRETIVVGKKDLFAKEKEIILKFELNQLLRPEQSQIEIRALKINFREDKSKVISINETYNFNEIRAIVPTGFGKKELRKNRSNASKIKTIYVLEERYFNRDKDLGHSNSSTSSKLSRSSKSSRPTKSSRSKPDTDKLKESLINQKKELNPQIIRSKEGSISTDKSIVIEETTPISTVVSKVESKIESKLDLETMKLDMDIKHLCYSTIDLLLSNLPLPEFNEEHRASNAMVKSIHKYINTELLRNEQEGGESA